MKTRTIFQVIFGAVLVYSCQVPVSPKSHETLKSELFAVEKEFCDMAQSEGVQNAFVHFAADSAVVQRKSQLVKGKESIKHQYESFPRDVKLLWKPDFADVSTSGDLGYTYGKYTYTTTDSLGHTTQSEGIFHTVWKRQPDGQWRFVWD